MNKIVRFSIVLLAVSFASGCAFSVYDTNVAYEYVGDVALPTGSEGITLGEFTDSRSVENKRWIMNQKNTYGMTTSGGWQAEKPLVEIVRDGIGQALKISGTEPATRSLELTGELVDFSGDIIMGMWSGQFKGTLTQKFRLKDAGSEQTVWSDTFTATATTPGKEGVEGMVRATIDALVDKLTSDPEFVQRVSPAN